MEIRPGKVISFDAGAYTAVIQMSGSLSVYLSNVPVARNIASGEMVTGRSCAILLFDDTNPQDAVVIAVYT